MEYAIYSCKNGGKLDIFSFDLFVKFHYNQNIQIAL